MDTTSRTALALALAGGTMVAASAVAQPSQGGSGMGPGMMGGYAGGGWMGGYGGIWLPVLLVVVIAGLVAWIVSHKKK